MIECEKDTILMMEYEPGMFRKVMVAGFRSGYKQCDPIQVVIVGMTSRFSQETGEEVYRRGYFRRKISAYDPAKIEGTKIEKERRRLVKRLSETDWSAMTLDQLRAVNEFAAKQLSQEVSDFNETPEQTYLTQEILFG